MSGYRLRALSTTSHLNSCSYANRFDFCTEGGFETALAAKERYDTIRLRNDTIAAFLPRIRGYRCEKDEANRYSCLLRWIEKQIPSIESELSSLNSDNNPDKRTPVERAIGRKAVFAS